MCLKSEIEGKEGTNYKNYSVKCRKILLFLLYSLLKYILLYLFLLSGGVGESGNDEEVSP